MYQISALIVHHAHGLLQLLITLTLLVAVVMLLAWLIAREQRKYKEADVELEKLMKGDKKWLNTK